VIPLARPDVGAPELAAVERVLSSGWLTQGPEVEAFEQGFARTVGAPHACAASSGTAALYLALRAVGVGPGTEVLTVSHSFIATADAIRMTGALPVFVDVDPATANLDPTLLRGALTTRTTAVLCVHQLGMPAPMAEILDLAGQAGVPVVEDAACAVGSALRCGDRWERIGRPHGAAACFSFHPRKVLTTGDGGMVTTASPDLDGHVRRGRVHGASIGAHERHVASRVTVETYDQPGFNFRLTDLQAAVGRAQLERLAGSVARRRELAARYAVLLGGLAGVTLPVEPEWARSNWQAYAVRLDDAIDRDEVVQRMRERGVATKPGVMCIHRESAYPPEAWRAGSDLTQGERAQDHGLQLPLHPGLTDDEQDRVVEALTEVLAP